MVTVAVTPTPEPAEPSEEPVDAAATSSPAPTSSASDESETDARVLEETARDQPLTLGDIFNVEGEWTEDRYNVSDRSDIRALGARVLCSSSTRSLELRLARRFDTLSFTVGQDNASDSSQEVLVVEVIGNGEQMDVRRVPFDQVQPFDLPITGVNAVIIDFSLERPCDDSVIAVVESLTVS